MIETKKHKALLQQFRHAAYPWKELNPFRFPTVEFGAVMRCSPVSALSRQQGNQMNKSILVGSILAAIGVAAPVTMVMLNNEPAYAEVLHVQPVTEIISTPRQECHEEVVTHVKPTKDPDQVTGTVVGAVVGGLLGHQIGGGKGKKLATLAGAAAGGYAGNKAQENMQANNTYTTTETLCQTVTDSEEKLIGYDVEYRLGDRVASVRMTELPGDRIPVENGQLVLTQATANQDAH